MYHYQLIIRCSFLNIKVVLGSFIMTSVGHSEVNVTSSAILGLIDMYFDSSMTIIY